MASYLVQDHRFLDSFLTMLGAAIATADTFEARLRFGRFAGMVSGEENTCPSSGVLSSRRSDQVEALAHQGFHVKRLPCDAASVVG
ncbi:hypothetical protein [uncultured Nitratireductor sp.]|uniref:hypothetical protein n=1 Tax=uncultured Nitratireductor sp. TaxID=520953 RepID=UPI0025F33AB5|nr:hypothetical protein [uncultured Nitratireductor sp.]